MLDLFRNETDLKSCGPGTTVFANGDRGDAMFVILEGQVDLFMRGKLLETLGPGDVVGEMALIDKAPRAASAVARTACKLVSVSEKRMAARLRRMNSRR